MRDSEGNINSSMGSNRSPFSVASMTTNLNATADMLTDDALSDILLIKRCAINNTCSGNLSKKSVSMPGHCVQRNHREPLWSKKSVLKWCPSMAEVEKKFNDDNNNVFFKQSNENIDMRHDSSLDSITEETPLSHNGDFSSLQYNSDYFHSSSPISSMENVMESTMETCARRQLEEVLPSGHDLPLTNARPSSLSPDSLSSLLSRSTQSFNHTQNCLNNANNSPKGVNALVKSGCLVLVSQNDNATHQTLLKNKSGSSCERICNNTYNRNLSTMSSNSTCKVHSRCPVMVKIHQKSKYEKYAVVASSRRHQTTPPFYLRLKNAHVTYNPNCPCQVVVSLNGADAKCYRFEATNPELAKEWCQAFTNESPTPSPTSCRKKLFSRHRNSSDQLMVISEKNEFRLSSPSTYDHDGSQSESPANLNSPLSPRPSFQEISLTDKSMFILPRTSTLPVLSETVEESDDDIANE